MNLPNGADEFPDGLILISGRNSYGKSTILEGILFAFFGPRIFKGRNAESFITYGTQKSEIYVYFTLDNRKYYIYRKWGRTGTITTKLFEWIEKKKIYQEVKRF
ncbi:MAG: AAA family ATPase, partial [Candidatus Hodarchaeota archaeon]